MAVGVGSTEGAGVDGSSVGVPVMSMLVGNGVGPPVPSGSRDVDVGAGVEAGVGDCVGAAVGAGEGAGVGPGEGAVVGTGVGASVGGSSCSHFVYPLGQRPRLFGLMHLHQIQTSL